MYDDGSYVALPQSAKDHHKTCAASKRSVQIIDFILRTCSGTCFGQVIPSGSRSDCREQTPSSAKKLKTHPVRHESSRPRRQDVPLKLAIGGDQEATSHEQRSTGQINKRTKFGPPLAHKAQGAYQDTGTSQREVDIRRARNFRHDDCNKRSKSAMRRREVLM